MAQQDYPSIWIDYEPTTALQTAGIGHTEDAIDGGAFNRGFRWRFQGSATFTVVAFTSFERDRLFDAMVRTIAFSEQVDDLNAFRKGIDENPYIGFNINFDQIEQRGFGAGQGTPWGTDDMIYEATIAVGLLGEFVATADGTLLPLEAVKLWSWSETLEFDPTLGTSGGRWIG